MSQKRAGPSESHVKIHSRLCSVLGQEDVEDGGQECLRERHRCVGGPLSSHLMGWPREEVADID